MRFVEAFARERPGAVGAARQCDPTLGDLGQPVLSATLRSTTFLALGEAAHILMPLDLLGQDMLAPTADARTHQSVALESRKFGYSSQIFKSADFCRS